MRPLALIVIASLLTIGFVLDREPRDLDRGGGQTLVGVPVADEHTWFCPGGSDRGGPGEVGVELINFGTQAARAEVSAFRSDDQEVPMPLTVTVEPAGRTAVSLVDQAPGTDWVGAVVEVFDADVVVEQTFDGATGTDRAPCFTRTAASFVIADGATRDLFHGERMVLLLLNPFHEDAVVDVVFDADVGPDSLSAVVIPGRRLVAIDVTREVTVAERVSAVITAVSGRIAAARLQVRDDEEVRGLEVTPAVPNGAVVSVLPVLARGPERLDVVTVTNPSREETAEVDLEILTDGSVTLDPIELTVRPGRTVRVDLSTESRLGELDSFGLVVRSLGGLPVGAMAQSTVQIGASEVPGVAAMPAEDAAALSWVAPVNGESSLIAIANPSASQIATVEVSVVEPGGRRVVATVEVGPGRRTTFTAAELGGDRPIVLVESTAPVVVARELVGFTSRQMAAAVIRSGPVPVALVE